MIELGRRVKDLVTGIEGIAVGRCEYLNGCVQIYIRPKAKKTGEEVEGIWADDIQVKDLGPGVTSTIKSNIKKKEKEKVKNGPGGPKSFAPPGSYRS